MSNVNKYNCVVTINHRIIDMYNYILIIEPLKTYFTKAFSNDIVTEYNAMQWRNVLNCAVN